MIGGELGPKGVILCVDDEKTPLILRTSVLRKAGFEVVPAESAAGALAIIDSQAVDLVLTDMLMPGISGAELAREVKLRRPELPVVLLSGVNEIPTSAPCVDLFLSKLEGPAVLCERLGEILDRSRKTRLAETSDEGTR